MRYPGDRARPHDKRRGGGLGRGKPRHGATFSGEWAAGAFAVLRDWLAPAVVGSAPSTGEDLGQQLDRFRGNQFAKAALDMAWWDLHARLQDRPLHELLDGSRPAIEVGPTLRPYGIVEEFLTLIGDSLAAGFSRVKLKFRPGWDVEMLRVVRQEFPGADVPHRRARGGWAWNTWRCSAGWTISAWR